MTARLSIFCFLMGLSFALSEAAVLGPNTWAVLVAGSRGWWNYRHQADICHAYHALIEKGVQEERIITIMYDDIANHESNPEPGKIFNRPGGPDVYQDVVIDYKRESVTAKNFLHILEGNEAEMENIGSGKVLKSTENDTVFINFADHGGTGVLCFPFDDMLHARDLIKTLNKMSEKNMFDKLIMYIEACESGSMFDNLINHLPNVFVSTASAVDESSWGWYCDEKEFDTCFGDLYSITWMERLDQLNSSETLFDNYNALRTAVTKSHVQVYGDYRLGFMSLFDTEEGDETDSVSQEIHRAVNSRDVPLYTARRQLEFAKDPESILRKKEQLKNLIEARSFADTLFSKILKKYTEGDAESKWELEGTRLPLHVDMLPCYEDLINTFENNCFNIPKNSYFLKHLYKLANICVKDLVSIKAVKAIQYICQEEKETIDNIPINIE